MWCSPAVTVSITQESLHRCIQRNAGPGNPSILLGICPVRCSCQSLTQPVQRDEQFCLLTNRSRNGMAWVPCLCYISGVHERLEDMKHQVLHQASRATFPHQPVRELEPMQRRPAGERSAQMVKSPDLPSPAWLPAIRSAWLVRPHPCIPIPPGATRALLKLTRSIAPQCLLCRDRYTSGCHTSPTSEPSFCPRRGQQRTHPAEVDTCHRVCRELQVHLLGAQWIWIGACALGIDISRQRIV